MTHLDRVKRHLLDYGSLTQLECAKEYSNYRLSEYIRQLREQGWEIESQWQKGKNKYGEDTHFVKYVLLNRNYIILEMGKENE